MAKWSMPITQVKPLVQNTPVIGLYLPTRGRMKQCFQVLGSWIKMAADPANMKILVGVDHDDLKSQEYFREEGFELLVFDKDVITNGTRARLLGEALDVDIYLAIVDYWFCCTPNWDNNLRGIMCNNEVANLACVHEMASFNFTAISRKWRDLANPLESPLFPFWFCDQWRLEMSCYVFNKSPELFSALSCYGKHERTHNLHDLDYWWGLFHALRPLRVRQCHDIAKAYGYAPENFHAFVASRQKQIEHYTNLDFWKRPQLPALEKQFGDVRGKSEKYLRAKAIADQFIQEEGLEIWKMKPIV